MLHTFEYTDTWKKENNLYTWSMAAYAEKLLSVYFPKFYLPSKVTDT